MTKNARKVPVIIGMSGGVDSSVAAALLLEQGYRVSGLFMKNWEEDDTATHCAAAEDLNDARQVCATLGIPLRTVNFAAEYWDRVFRHFLAQYRAGYTPNPDVLCNREIKFRAFLDHALALGAERIATGHYARIRHAGGHHHLLKGCDAGKDQTYFLYAIDQRALGRTLFPVGEMSKDLVRAQAKALGLGNHAKKDSTGICFIGERKFDEFLGRYLPARPGEIRTVEGELKGHHRGLMFHTIGQRQGLGIGGPGPAWYVVGKDLARNRLLVAQGADHPALFARVVQTGRVQWITAPAGRRINCGARIRHRQPVQACTLEVAAGGQGLVTFESPQRAVTPGQSVVFYRNDECLGGAVIRGARATAGPVARSA